MKKILIGIAATLTILPMLAFAQTQGDVNPNPTSSSCVSVTHNLQYRSRDAQTGGDVSTLQDFLQSQGYLNSEPTGYFGLLTQAAAKAYQSASGILNSGYVGPITRAKITSKTCGGTIPVNPVLPVTPVTPVTPITQPVVVNTQPTTNPNQPSILSTNPNQAQVGQSLTVYFSKGGHDGSVILKTPDGSKSWHVPYTTGTVYNGFIYYDGSKVTFTVPSTIGRGQLPENTGYEAPIAITSGTYNLSIYALSGPTNNVSSLTSNPFSITINSTPTQQQPTVDQIYQKLLDATRLVIDSATYDSNFDFNNDGRINSIDLARVRVAIYPTDTTATTTNMDVYTKLSNAITSRLGAKQGDSNYIAGLDLDSNGFIQSADGLLLRSAIPTPIAPTPVPTQPNPQPVTPPTSSASATITITSPNGGEVWNPGETHDITWTSSDVNDYKYVILAIQGIPDTNITPNAPSGLQVIVRSILNSDGKYSWTIPADISSLSGKERAKIQIIAISASGKTNIGDLTDGFFSISGAKTLSCTYTDGGKDYNTKGLIVDNTTTMAGGKWDRCSDQSQVWEFSCQNGVAVGEYHTCPNGCYDGACRP